MAIEEKVIQTNTEATETVAAQPPAQPPSCLLYTSPSPRD